MAKIVTLNIQLLNSNITLNSPSDIIEDYNTRKVIESNENYIIYKRSGPADYPKWLKNFLTNIKDIMSNSETILSDALKFSKKKSEGILLLIKVPCNTESRVFAISFGSGRFELKATAIERGFGIYTAYHLSKSENSNLKSYQSRLIDINPVNKKMVFAGEIDNTSGIPYVVDNERIKELSISNLEKSLYSRAIGKTKSLEIAFSFNNDQIPCLNYLSEKLAVILQAYLSITDEEKQELYKGLVLVSSDKIENINTIFIEQLQAASENTDPENFFLFEPEIDFDWAEVSAIQYSYERENITDDVNKALSINKIFELLPTIDSVEKLKNIKITLLGNNSEIIKQWSAFQCIYGEIITNSETYIISDEEYYQIARDKYNRIKRNINRAMTNLEIPSEIIEQVGNEIASRGEDQRITREFIFNKKYAQYLNAELMDEQRKHIRLFNEDQFEVCDILHNNCFYHTKIKRNPESMSHLFQQGYVSGASFAKYTNEYIEATNDVIENSNHRLSGTPNGKTIHYLVLSQAENPRLSFFQKMSLEEKITSLTAYQFTVKISLIKGCPWAR